MNGNWPLIVFTSDRCVTGSGSYSGGWNCMPVVGNASDLPLADTDTNVANTKVRGLTDAQAGNLAIGDMRWRAEGVDTYYSGDGTGGPKLWMFCGFDQPTRFVAGGDRPIYNPCISADGSTVVFESTTDDMRYVADVVETSDDFASNIWVGRVESSSHNNRVWRCRIGIGAHLQSSGLASYITVPMEISPDTPETEAEMHPVIGN